MLLRYQSDTGTFVRGGITGGGAFSEVAPAAAGLVAGILAGLRQQGMP
jgi:tRNA U34 5-carboxymethylaminomethyl modifying enzyme MnmG/GidA